MRPESFNKLCGLVRPFIEKSDTHLRKCIPVEQRVAVALWTLATNVEYRTIGHLFGISRSSVCIIVKEVCNAIHQTLLFKYIYLPFGQELLQIMQKFETTWGFPNCAGAIDGCHIPIIAPKENHTDYYNRKGIYSIILHATVDCNYLIRDVCIGWPGKVHDARVLANSEMYRLGQSGKLFANETCKIQGTDVPVVILGDPAYPLLPWLMKPYAETARTSPAQYRFNYTLSRNRMVVENVFGRLKGRWRRLLKGMDFSVQSVPIIISACCILHNFGETEGDAFADEWRFDCFGGDGENCQETSAEQSKTTADNIPEAFCRHFSPNL
ncbi:uncharacterized protein LOC135470681 [Liolophura sinensis]|uniref:uncharacterized protein LOC135470681 n=1 Tax=Liolophura sinensis TaxID=3198878 RepID=UPI00315869EA